MDAKACTPRRHRARALLAGSGVELGPPPSWKKARPSGPRLNSESAHRSARIHERTRQSLQNHSKSEILDNFISRIKNTEEMEFIEACAQVERIAEIRLLDII